MPDSSRRFNEETQAYSVSLPESFVEDLAEQYPRARSVTQAVYMAAEEAVEHRRQKITSEDITDAIISATEQAETPFVLQTDESE